MGGQLLGLAAAYMKALGEEALLFACLLFFGFIIGIETLIRRSQRRSRRRRLGNRAEELFNAEREKRIEEEREQRKDVERVGAARGGPDGTG